MDAIKGIINQVIKAIEPTGQNEKQRILISWHKALPAKYKNHCQIVDFRQKRLVVNVDSTNWLYQLNLEKEKLIKKLNKQLKKDIIEDMYFRVGNVSNNS